jgi:uncharacterized membrane protein
MILLLSTVAIVSIGLMTGVEFAVWVFINPVLRKLADQPRAQAVVMFARRLGRAMPFWYSSNLLLLIAEWALLRRTSGAALLAAAAGLWALVIVLTVLFLVPINNRLAREEAHASAQKAHREHKRWDSLHRARVIALVVAMVLLLVAIHA